MYYPACLLALLLVLSVQGMEVGELFFFITEDAIQEICNLFCTLVARVRFSQQQYTVKERGPTICVDVINELNPADRDFTVSFSFSKYHAEPTNSSYPVSCIHQQQGGYVCLL